MGYLEIKGLSAVRLAEGEAAILHRDFWPAVDARAMHVTISDVGIGELARIAAMAESRGMATAPHRPFGPVAAAAHVIAVQRDYLYLECP